MSKDVAGSDYNELIILMDNLGSKRAGFYPQYLTEDEYEEFIQNLRSGVDFNNLVEEEAGEENVKEE